MEGERELNSGLPVKGDEVSVSESYRVTSRDENISQSSGPAVVAAAAAPPTSIAVAPAMEMLKKKRGRPRKYGPDGTLTSAALSPMPISASIPLSGDFSVWKQPRGRGSGRGRGRGRRPLEDDINAHKLEYLHQGDQLAYMVSGRFLPHVITVNAGEDVAMKIYSFGLQEPGAICILSASGSISNVTIRQSDSSGGTMTYEGRFEILSLSGSFMPTDDGIMKSRSGGISVSLAGSDGRVFGGGLAGLLIAATPVQVVIGSFLPGQQQEQKPRESRIETASPMTRDMNPPIIGEADRAGYGGQKAAEFTSPTSYHSQHTSENNNHANNNNNGSSNPMIGMSGSTPDGESNDDSPLKYESSG